MCQLRKSCIKQINACCNWVTTSGLVESNPFKDLAKTIKSKRKDNTILTFNKEEIAIIIDAFASNKYCPKYFPLAYSYYTNYVRCLFLTGCRREEAVALNKIKGKLVAPKVHSDALGLRATLNNSWFDISYKKVLLCPDETT